MSIKIVNYVAGVLVGGVMFFFVFVAMWYKPSWPVLPYVVWVGIVLIPVILVFRRRDREFWAGVVSFDVLVLGYLLLEGGV